MKKSTIKRRKRVVPAYPEAPFTEGPPSQSATSASPEPGSNGEEQAEVNADAPAAKRRRPPLSVDFSGYQPEAINAEDSFAPNRDEHNAKSPSGDTDYARQAELAAAAAQQSRLDPSSRGVGEAESDTGKLERRAELLREADAMRAALAAKEKEINDLR